MRKNLMLIAGISTLTSLAGPLLPAASATSGAESARYVINQPTEITITKVYFGTSWLGLTYNDINNKYEGKHVARVGVYSGEISDSLLYTQAYGIASAATTEDKENLARSITSDDLILVYLGQPPFNMMDKLTNGEEWFWHVDETHIGTLTSSRMSYFVELKRDIYDASEEPDIIIGKIDYGECRWAAGYNHGMSCRPEYHSEDDRYHYWMYDIGTNEPVLPRPEVELYKYDEKDDSGDNTGGDSGGSGDNTGENNGDNGGGTGGDSGDNNPDDGSGNNTGGDTGSNGEGNSGDNGDNNPDDNTGGDGGNTGDNPSDNTGDNNNPDDGGENGNGGENNDPSDGGSDNSGENTPSDPTNQPTTGDNSKTSEDTTPPADTPSAPSGEPTEANSGVADAQNHTQNPSSGAQSSNSDTDTTNSGTQNPNSGASNAASSVKTADSAANAANSEFAPSNTGSASGNTNSAPAAATFVSTPVSQDSVWRRIAQSNGHTAGNITDDGDTTGNTDSDSADAETADSAANITSDNDATDANLPLLGGPEEHQGNKLWWVVPVIIAAVLGLVSLLLVFPLFKRRKQNKD